MTIDQLEREFRFRRIRAETTLYGVFGQPIGHSASPAMHNAGFESLGIDAAYVPLAAADLDDVFAGASALGLKGASVTVPFKVGVMPYLASVEAEAEEIGAVNTLVRAADGWHGSNTDVAGFRAGLGDLDLTGWRVAVLGTGGAARAVASALRAWRCATTLYGRDAGRAQAVASSLGVNGAGRPVPARSWDLLVNTTPVGMAPGADASAFPEAVYDGRVVYDLVYNPPVTRLLREGADRGCRTVGGLDMLVEQARLQAARWTGRQPEADVMREAARWKLSTFSDRS
jgi:shikimate dehydrogenase